MYREKYASILEEAQRPIYLSTTHKSQTLLDSTSRLNKFWLQTHTVFLHNISMVDVWRSSHPAGTDTQVTEQYSQTRTLELRWLLSNTTKAKVWALTLTGMMTACPHSGTKPDCLWLQNYKQSGPELQSGHKALLAQQ